jgi:hypothetical protein
MALKSEYHFIGGQIDGACAASRKKEHITFCLSRISFEAQGGVGIACRQLPARLSVRESANYDEKNGGTLQHNGQTLYFTLWFPTHPRVRHSGMSLTRRVLLKSGVQKLARRNMREVC